MFTSVFRAPLLVVLPASLVVPRNHILAHRQLREVRLTGIAGRDCTDMTAAGALHAIEEACRLTNDMIGPVALNERVQVKLGAVAAIRTRAIRPEIAIDAFCVAKRR